MSDGRQDAIHRPKRDAAGGGRGAEGYVGPLQERILKVGRAVGRAQSADRSAAQSDEVPGGTANRVLRRLGVFDEWRARES